MNEQFNWYKNPLVHKGITTLTCVQAGNENKRN